MNEAAGEPNSGFGILFYQSETPKIKLGKAESRNGEMSKEIVAN
jgi:hypothetical protein